MEKDWVQIYQNSQQHLAELIKGMLSEHEINAIVLSTRDSIYGSFGEYQLYVHRDDVIRANHLIEKHGN